MPRSKFTAVFAVLAALTLFFGGMLTYKVIGEQQTRAAVSRHSAEASGHQELLGIQGHAVIQVLRGGKVVASWKGHNSLSSLSRNAIASCLSGVSTTPIYFNGCSGMTSGIYLSVTSAACTGWCESAVARNTVLPSGCQPSSYQNGACNGWQTQATVPITSDETVVGAGAGIPNSIQFDAVSISPGLAVHNGDSVQTTITFTVG